VQLPEFSLDTRCVFSCSCTMHMVTVVTRARAEGIQAFYRHFNSVYSNAQAECCCC